MNKKIVKALNDQLNREFFSAYLYLALSAYFETENLAGFAHWTKIQAQEELGHAMKFYKHILERGGRVELKTIDSPKHQWNSPFEGFQEAYTHEKSITKHIHEIYALAEELNDYPTKVFLDWFVDEQVKEESKLSRIVEILRKIGDHLGGLYQLDHRLSKRQG